MSKYVFLIILVSSEGDEKDASHFLLPANLIPREDGISQYQGVPFPNQLGQISSNHILDLALVGIYYKVNFTEVLLTLC